MESRWESAESDRRAMGQVAAIDSLLLLLARSLGAIAPGQHAALPPGAAPGAAAAQQQPQLGAEPVGLIRQQLGRVVTFPHSQPSPTPCQLLTKSPLCASPAS
jgi:hypothetical protein